MGNNSGGVLLASVFSSPIWADSVTLSAVASATTVSVGDNFTVAVNIANVSDLYAYQFDLGFTNGVVAFTGVQEKSIPCHCGHHILRSGVSRWQRLECGRHQ